jgi:hypothetical protein
MMILSTTLATILYLAIRSYMFPIILTALRPLMKTINEAVSRRSAHSSRLTAERHMEVGLRFVRLSLILMLLWGLAYFMVSRLAIYSWPIWFAAGTLSFMHYLSAANMQPQYKVVEKC